MIGKFLIMLLIFFQIIFVERKRHVIIRRHFLSSENMHDIIRHHFMYELKLTNLTDNSLGEKVLPMLTAIYWMLHEDLIPMALHYIHAR